MVDIGFRPSTRETLTTPGYAFQDVFELAQLAEEKGFDSVWAGDSLLDRPRFETLTTLAGYAALTEDVTLGTACMVTPLRNPIQFAQAWITLDIISDGRMLLGACMGTPQDNRSYEAVGVPHKRRATVLTEGLEVMRALWRDGEVTYSGDYFEYEDIAFESGAELRPFEPVQDDPPVIIASNPSLHGNPSVVDKAVKRIVDVGDGWLTCCRADHPEEFEQQWAAIKDYAKEQGKDPDDIKVVYNLATHIADSRSEARTQMKEFVSRYFPRFDPEVVDDMGPTGTADDIIDHMERFLDLGVDDFVFRFEAEDRFEQMDKFADEVLPSF